MKTPAARINPFSGVRAMAISLALCAASHAQTPPDLTAAGAIAALKTSTLANAYPTYGETYNLGAAGLRGWVYLSSGWGTTHGGDGTMSGESRQILVTVAAAPANAVLAVDDVILGTMAGNSGTVPLFSSDCRKAFGAAIGDAEKTGAGTLRVKRWRAGATTDVNIPITIMGNYTATAPYSCPKSSLILTNARNKLVGELLADSNFLTNDWKGAISGLALLASVAPGDPNYATVQTRLQTYARALAAINPIPTGSYVWNWNTSIWNWSYIGLFLSEYYLSTNDAQVVTGLNNYTVALATSQSRYGTYGHGGAVTKADGSLHGTIPPYGPVNAAGIPANTAIVIGKKALLAAGQSINPEIDPAIQRGSDFFAWFVNKGGIPYGEHEPWMGNHESNGKDSMCAVLFGLQANRTEETEYFARMSIAAFNSREYGHTGQGFSYLWGALGANMGGPLATAEYLKNVRWHADLARRTDGSIGYDGAEQYGGGSTADGTYLGTSSYNGMNSTAMHLLTYSLPLQRLYITGKNSIPANTLDSTRVAHAVSSATFKQDSPSKTNGELITALSDFDPIVRHFAAIELGKRTPSSGELTTLRGMVTGTDANGRMGACHALGLLKDSAALSLINQRIDKNIESNSWVRAKAAAAIREYPPATASVHRDSMLTAYTANATDPEVIVWDDPVQIANNYLSFALFGDAVYGGNNIANYTITAPKNLLYPAVKAGLKQPDSMSRTSAAQFCFDYLTLPDVQELALDIFEMISTKSQADTMWHSVPQTKGLQLLVKHKCAEGLPLALSMMDVHPAWGHGSSGYLSETMDSLKTYGDSARWTLPHLNQDISDLEDNLNPSDYVQILPQLVTTMATIDAATTSPSGIIHLLPLATPQVVTTTGAQAITLTGTSPRGAVTFTNVTAPAHGTLTGTAPNLTYTPNNGYTGPDHFNFQAVDSLTTSVPGTVSIIVGTAGTGLKGEYFNNADFTSLQLTRTDAQVNFDWGTGSPHASIGADTFSVRWSGVLLVPETGSYTFSALNSDGARLYINGLPTINQYADQSTNWNDGSPIALNEGQLVDIQMDYYENTGSAVAKLKWTGPSFAGDNGAIIGSQWLFDGTGMIRVPYAFAQSLTLLKNKPKAITLTGSAGSLTYSVVTPPTHGTLSGTAPYLTYNPAANYIGPDSFTFKTNNGTTDSAPATVSIDVIPANTFSVNFYDNGGLTTPEDRANLQLNPGMLAGLTDWLTYGWTNIQAPWAPSGPQAPATLTSNQGSTASFVFKDCRNGGPYNWSVPRTTLLGDGNGNLMDGHVNSTLDPGDGTNLFDMEVTGIPFAVYDVIFYIGANKDQYGDGTGVIKFNGGADRAFKLRPGAFDGTFTEMVDATTPGNYIVFSGMTGSSFTTQTWGTGPGGFNHIGPCGFQIREAVVADTTPPTLNGSSIDDDKSGGPVVQDTPVNYTVTFSEDMDASTVSAADFGNAGTSAVAIGTVSETSPGVFTVPVTPTSAGTLRLQVNAGAVLTDAAGNALVTTSAIIDDTTITVTSNTAPVANSQSVSTVQNTAKPITLTATDAEADPLTYTIVTQPANGSLSGTAPNVVYTPSSNYTGADSFTFKVNDGTLDSATATVSITVNPVSQITWGVATAITAASEIQGTGVSNLAGANFGITTGTTIIVPAAETGTVDVEFKSLGSGQSVTLSNGITVAVDSTWVNWGFSAANSAVTGNFGTVLDSNLGIEIGAPVSPSATFTLSGLTIGTQYQIQFFADSTGSNSQTLSGSAAMNSLNGQFVTGTFTADATTRVFTVTRNTDFAVVNAITIAKVGSPKVWNVNIGSELTTSDNFIGAATENTANSTWNNVGIVTNQALVDSTGAAGTVTLTFGGGADNLGNNTITGPEIFATWLKHSANTTPIAMTLGGLGPANTYDLVIYSDWYWQSGEPFPVTQTAGTGMSGTVTLNTRNGTQGVIPGLVEDTDPTNNSGVTGNWIRISGLTPDGSGTLAFNIGGTNAPLSGFQLVQTGNELANGAPVANDATFAVAEDTTIGASVGTVVATDPDAGDTLTYAITAGNDGSFAIDANTGDITTAAALDYETIASYALTVSATDAGGLSDAASVIITVINRNEVPVFAASLLIKANGTEASAYSGSVAGDASDPDAGDTLTFSKLSGPTWLAVASNGVLSGTPDAAAAGVNQWTVQVSDGNLAATATLQITVDALPAQTTHGATGETTPAGTIVSGSYVDTLSSDNSYERLQEIESGGKPSKRYSYFDHVWNFDLGSGGSQIVLSVEAHHSANSEGDDFVFAYSTDGVNYTNALTVTKTADNNTPQTFTLPSNLSGAIYIRASDTNQSQGKRALDSLYVDALGVEVTQ